MRWALADELMAAWDQIWRMTYRRERPASQALGRTRTGVMFSD